MAVNSIELVDVQVKPALKYLVNMKGLPAKVTTVSVSDVFLILSSVTTICNLML